MRSRKCLLVRADASTQVGAGHVMRCLALSKAWQSAEGDVTFASAEMLPALEARLREENIGMVAIQGEAGSGQDAASTCDLGRRLDAGWIVVDGYRFFPEYYRKLRNEGLRSLAIDDDGRFEDYYSDVVLNQNVSASESMYRNRQPCTRLLMGSGFVLLRPEFTRTTHKPVISKIAQKLLITMGGSDPENVTLKVVEALREWLPATAETRVVLGSGYRCGGELRTLVSDFRGSICAVENPPDMVPLMAWADLAISAAGGTCWELAYMGVPAVVMAISRDQIGIAQAISDRGVAQSLGWHARVTAAQLTEAVRSLMNDGERRCAMSHAGQELVDGRGPERVVQFLQGAA